MLAYQRFSNFATFIGRRVFFSTYGNAFACFLSEFAVDVNQRSQPFFIECFTNDRAILDITARQLLTMLVGFVQAFYFAF
jgi:hypothetical protein